MPLAKMQILQHLEGVRLSFALDIIAAGVDLSFV